MNDNGAVMSRACDDCNQIFLTFQFRIYPALCCALWRSSKLRHSQNMKLHIECNLFKHATIIFNLYWPHALLIDMKIIEISAFYTSFVNHSLND